MPQKICNFEANKLQIRKALILMHFVPDIFVTSQKSSEI